MLKKILSKYNVDIFGVTNNTDFSYLQNIYELKKNKNYFTSIDEKDFTKRADLKNISPNVKSIISMAFPYDTGDRFPDTDYYISKYAVRKDYHFVVKTILENIVKDLKEAFPNNHFEVYVDSNPLFEKEIAKLCGIGDFGKNTLLYTAKYGSYVFLGEILSDYKFEELKYSDFKTICHSCNLCIDYCPNNALKDNTLDSANCISYLACSKSDIEFEAIGKTIWGCDICQDLCPMNKDLSFSDISDFNLEKEFFLDLEKILNFPNKKLKEIFRFSPVMWTGTFPLKRNAIIQMANSKNKKYIDILELYIKTSQNERLIEYAKKSLYILKDQ